MALEPKSLQKTWKSAQIWSARVFFALIKKITRRTKKQENMVKSKNHQNLHERQVDKICKYIWNARSMPALNIPKKRLEDEYK